jgi:8-oxo-dGTP pyrophosphatase MutT (NUDIX family)
MHIATEWFYKPGEKAPAVLKLFQRGEVIPDVRRARVVCFCKGKLVLVYESSSAEWSFPGGKVEVGETAEQGAIREVFEESGRSVKSITPLGVLQCLPPHEDVQRLWFAAEVTEGPLGAIDDPAGEVAAVMECEPHEVRKYIPWLHSVEDIVSAAEQLTRQ